MHTVLTIFFYVCSISRISLGLSPHPNEETYPTGPLRRLSNTVSSRVFLTRSSGVTTYLLVSSSPFRFISSTNWRSPLSFYHQILFIIWPPPYTYRPRVRNIPFLSVHLNMGSRGNSLVRLTLRPLWRGLELGRRTEDHEGTGRDEGTTRGEVVNWFFGWSPDEDSMVGNLLRCVYSNSKLNTKDS